MSEPDDDLKPEYDLESLRNGVRGKYYERHLKKSNVVVIEPDLTKAFPNANAVNDALRETLRNRGTAATEQKS